MRKSMRTEAATELVTGTAGRCRQTPWHGVRASRGACRSSGRVAGRSRPWPEGALLVSLRLCLSWRARSMAPGTRALLSLICEFALWGSRARRVPPLPPRATRVHSALPHVCPGPLRLQRGLPSCHCCCVGETQVSSPRVPGDSAYPLPSRLKASLWWHRSLEV